MDARDSLLALINEYSPCSSEETLVRDFHSFIEANPECADRNFPPGHLTGSAFILSPDQRALLFVHHRKLDKWLQPGGHADGDFDLMGVAKREALEETGLTVEPLTPIIFDLDLHLIPARGEQGAHYHYDVRFLFLAPTFEVKPALAEIHGARWVILDEVEAVTEERGIVRVVKKIRDLIE